MFLRISTVDELDTHRVKAGSNTESSSLSMSSRLTLILLLPFEEDEDWLLDFDLIAKYLQIELAPMMIRLFESLSNMTGEVNPNGAVSYEESLN